MVQMYLKGRAASQQGMIQGSQHQGKSWKTWKMEKAFSRPGKSYTLKNRPKPWNLRICPGKIMQKLLAHYSFCILW